MNGKFVVERAICSHSKAIERCAIKSRGNLIILSAFVAKKECTRSRLKAFDVRKKIPQDGTRKIKRGKMVIVLWKIANIV